MGVSDCHSVRDHNMDKLSQAQSELREMDALASGNSPVHRLHPMCKLLVTVLYIFVTVSFRFLYKGIIINHNKNRANLH